MNTYQFYTETRGGLIENVHTGSIVVVNSEGRVVHSSGTPDDIYYYRSTSKPIQALPIFERELDLRHGIPPAQSAIFAASHLGDDCHVTAVRDMLQRLGYNEQELIMLPDKGRAGGVDKASHGCSGKHVALMMLAQELCGDYRDYWRTDSAAQQEVLRAISRMTDIPVEQVHVGIDGCGVPVFAVPLRAMALSFVRLACPDIIADSALASAATRLGAAITAYPHMLRGEGSADTILNSDPNLIGKSGQHGVYAIGLRRERLGVAFKIDDGDDSHLPALLAAVLRGLGYSNTKLIDELDRLMPTDIRNATNAVVGRINVNFAL